MPRRLPCTRNEVLLSLKTYQICVGRMCSRLNLRNSLHIPIKLHSLKYVTYCLRKALLVPDGHKTIIEISTKATSQELTKVTKDRFPQWRMVRHLECFQHWQEGKLAILACYFTKIMSFVKVSNPAQV